MSPTTMIECPNAPGHCKLMAKACLKRHQRAKLDPYQNRTYQSDVHKFRRTECHTCKVGKMVDKELKGQVDADTKTCPCGERFEVTGSPYMRARAKYCPTHKIMTRAERRIDIARIKKGSVSEYRTCPCGEVFYIGKKVRKGQPIKYCPHHRAMSPYQRKKDIAMITRQRRLAA